MLSCKDETPTLEKKKYISMIRGLQYLNHRRPYKEYEVGRVEINQLDPRETHYAVVKIIFRYLKGTSNYGLWHEKSNNFTLCAYIDVDWARKL